MDRKPLLVLVAFTALVTVWTSACERLDPSEALIEDF